MSERGTQVHSPHEIQWVLRKLKSFCREIFQPFFGSLAAVGDPYSWSYCSPQDLLKKSTSRSHRGSLVPECQPALGSHTLPSPPSSQPPPSPAHHPGKASWFPLFCSELGTFTLPSLFGSGQEQLPEICLCPRQSCLKCKSLIMRRKTLGWKGEREGRRHQGKVVCRLAVPISLFEDFSFSSNEGRVTLYCLPWDRGVAPDAIPLLFRFPVWVSTFPF